MKSRTRPSILQAQDPRSGFRLRGLLSLQSPGKGTRKPRGLVSLIKGKKRRRK